MNKSLVGGRSARSNASPFVDGAPILYRAGAEGPTKGEQWLAYRDLLSEAARGDFGRVPAAMREPVRADVERINAALVELRSQPGARLSDVLRATAPSQVQGTSPLLTSLSIQYGNDAAIGLSLAPVVQVSKIADSYPDYAIAARLAATDDDEGGGDPIEHDDGNRSLTNSYATKERSRTHVLPFRTMQNESQPFDEMLDLIDALKMRSELAREVRIAAALQTSGNYGSNTVTPGASEKWDSAGGGDPKGVLTDAATALWPGNGPTKRVAFCGRLVWDVLKSHPALLDVTKYTKGGFITPAQFAELIEVDEFYVGSMRKRTSVKGQTATYDRVWGNYFGMMNVPRGAVRLRNVMFAATFRFGTEQMNVEFTRGQVGSKRYPSGAYVATNVHDEDYKAGIAANAGYLVVNPLT